MKTLVLSLDDDLDEALEELGAEQGRTKDQVVVDLLRRCVETERLKRTLHDPNLSALYADLADEDVALAEEGMADYHKILEAADRE